MHIERFVTDPLSGRLSRYMDLVAFRQNLVTSNVANADTPGYRTKDIDFQSEFQSAVASREPAIREVQGLPVKNDGNDVNLDREARLLAENGIRFNVATQLLRNHNQLIHTVLKDGSV